MQHIGQRMRAVRDAKGLTLQYVASRLGDVAHTTVHDHERSADPKHSTVLRIAEILEVAPAFLRGEDSTLETLGIERVVRRESLRVYCETHKVEASERTKLSRLQDFAAAPRAVDAWRVLHALIGVYSGRSPDAALLPSAPRSTAGTERSKRVRALRSVELRMIRMDLPNPRVGHHRQHVG
jgi:transcriptional regulator with XRE-family HTH domain